MTRKWFGIVWGARPAPDAPTNRGSAPYQFMVEYWKHYEEYMQRKEHLIEAAITAYSGLAALLLTRSTQTWQHQGFWLVLFGIVVSVVVEQFIYAEFQHWQSGVKLTIAAQRVAADWLSRSQVAAEDLEPVTSPEARDVRMPRALKTELATIHFPVVPGIFFKRWVNIARSGGSFARTAYRLMWLWWLAYVIRALTTQTPEWWGLRDLWVLVRRAWS